MNKKRAGRVEVETRAMQWEQGREEVRLARLRCGANSNLEGGTTKVHQETVEVAKQGVGKRFMC